MKRFLSAMLVVILAFACAACTSDSDKDTDSDDVLNVGFIYTGYVNDEGYTQAHHSGTKAVEDYFDGKVNALIYEGVDDSNKQTVRDAADSLIDQGAKVIVGDGSGFGETLYEMATSGNYDDTIFLHFSGKLLAANMGNYFGAMEEPRYLTGIIAGMQTKTNKLGYVAAFPQTEVLIGVNAFMLGARSVNPDVEVQVIYINSWYDPAKEQQAAEALLDQGCDIITQHCFTSEPQIAAESVGALAIGYNLDNPGAAPDAWLTAPIWHHERFLIPTIEKIIAGTWVPESYYGRLRDGYVDLAPLSELVTPEANEAVEEARKGILSGEINVFTGPLIDNAVNKVVSDDVVLDRESIWLIYFLLEGISSTEI